MASHFQQGLNLRENQEPAVAAGDNINEDMLLISKHSGGAVQEVHEGRGRRQGDKPEGGTAMVVLENPWLFRCGRRGEDGREGSPWLAYDRHAKTSREVHAVEDELGNIKGKVDQEIWSHTVGFVSGFC